MNTIIFICLKKRIAKCILREKKMGMRQKTSVKVSK